MAGPDAQPGERVRLDNLPVSNVATQASCGLKYCIPDALVPFQGKSWVARFEPLFNTGAGGQEAEGTTWSEEEDGFREVLTLPVPSESLVSFSEDSVRRRLGPVSLASLAVYKLSTVVRIECRKLSTAICCRSQGSCVATEVRRSRPAMSRALPPC